MNKTKIINAAQKAVQKGQYDKAISLYQKLVEDDPKDVRTLLKIGEIHTKKGDKTEAKKIYKRVGESYSEQGFFQKAVAVYKQALKYDARDVEVMLKLAELFEQLGVMNDAMAQYQAVAALHDKSGNTKDALKYLARMVELDPENVAARVRLAETYSRENMVEDAVEHFDKAAEVLRKQDRIGDYMKVVERLVYHDQTRIDLIKDLARRYLERADTKRALAKLQIAFKAKPRDEETLQLLAKSFQDLGQPKKTVFVYKELAKIYQETGRLDEARAVYGQILELEPDDVEASEGLKAAAPAFGAPAFGAPAFGGGFANAFGGAAGFGAAPEPAPAFGAAAPFGAPAHQPQPIGFGSSTPGSSAFGAPAASPFNSPAVANAFGAPAAPAFGAPAPAFGVVAGSAIPGSGGQFGPSFPHTGEMPAFGASQASAPQFGQAFPQTGFMGAFDASQLRAGFGVSPGAPGFPSPAIIPAPPPATPSPIAFRNPLADAPQKPFSPVESRTPAPPPRAGSAVIAARVIGKPIAKAPPPLKGQKPENLEISKLLTETDVYIKYGLKDKAIEHINRLLTLDPLHIDAYYKLRDIHLGARDGARAAEAVANILKIYAHIGDEDRVEALRAELRGLAPGHPLAQPGVIPPPPTASELASASAKDDVAVDIDIDIDDDDVDAAEPEAAEDADEPMMVASADELDDEPGVEMEIRGEDEGQGGPAEDLDDEPMPYQDDGMPGFQTGDIQNVNEAMFGLFGESRPAVPVPDVVAAQSPFARTASALNRFDARLADAPDEDEPVFGMAAVDEPADEDRTPVPGSVRAAPVRAEPDSPTERITQIPGPRMPEPYVTSDRATEDALMRDSLFSSEEEDGEPEADADAGATPLDEQPLLTAEEAEAALAGLDEALDELELGEAGGLDELEEEDSGDVSAQALMGMGTQDIEAQRVAYESYFAQSSEAGQTETADHALGADLDLVGEARSPRQTVPIAAPDPEPVDELSEADFAELEEPIEAAPTESYQTPGDAFDDSVPTGDVAGHYDSGRNGELHFEAREASEEEAVAAVPEIDEEIEGELDEADFLLSQSMLDEARENLLEILEKKPLYPRALAMLEDVEKQLGMR